MSTNVTINIIINQPSSNTKQPDMKFDGEKWVLDRVLNEIKKNGPIRGKIK
jgi:prophage antirepressor-like protein